MASARSSIWIGHRFTPEKWVRCPFLRPMKNNRLEYTDLVPLVRWLYNYQGHSAGCCLHIVLDDGNWRDRDIKYCIEHACSQEHALLGAGLMMLSKTQRRKLARNWAARPQPRDPLQGMILKMNQQMYYIDPQPHFNKILKVFKDAGL